MPIAIIANHKNRITIPSLEAAPVIVLQQPIIPLQSMQILLNAEFREFFR